MNKKSINRTKQVHGAPLRRSEFDDELLRNNMRSNNRLKTQMQYQDRAQRVIMKDLGRESNLLQTKLENDRKIISLGLYGHTFGTSSQQNPRKYTPTSPTGKTQSSFAMKSATQSMSFNKEEKKFPWDKDPTDVESAIAKESVPSNKTSVTKNSARMKDLFTRYPSSRAQSDDFLASLLNDAMNDEIHYTKSPEMRSANVTGQEGQKTARRRRTRTPLEGSSSSLVNAQNVRETEPVFQ